MFNYNFFNSEDSLFFRKFTEGRKDDSIYDKKQSALVNDIIRNLTKIKNIMFIYKL